MIVHKLILIATLATFTVGRPAFPLDSTKLQSLVAEVPQSITDTLSAFDADRLRRLLARIPASISNDEIANHLSRVTAYVSGPRPANRDPVLWFARWDSPIRLKVVDADDRDIALNFGMGGQVEAWVSRIRYIVGIDIRIASGREEDANAVVLIGGASTLATASTRLKVRHDGQDIWLRPKEALGPASSFHENLGPPTVECGSRVFGGSIKAFAMIMGLNEVSLDSNHLMFSDLLAECLAIGLGLRRHAPGSSEALANFTGENPLPLLALLYSIDRAPGTSSEEVRAEAFRMLSALRPR